MLFVLSNPFAKFTVQGVEEKERNGGRGRGVCYCTGGLTSNASGDLLSLLAAFDFPYVFVARLNAKRSSSLSLYLSVYVFIIITERKREREREGKSGVFALTFGEFVQ